MYPSGTWQQKLVYDDQICEDLGHLSIFFFLNKRTTAQAAFRKKPNKGQEVDDTYILSLRGLKEREGPRAVIETVAEERVSLKN